MIRWETIEELQQAKDNLQKDYQEAVDKINNMKLDIDQAQEIIIELQQENKQLKERFENLVQEHIDTITRNEEKQQRIDKAIEYIKHYGNLYCLKHIQFKKYKQYEELLEILGGK